MLELRSTNKPLAVSRCTTKMPISRISGKKESVNTTNKALERHLD